MRGLFMGMLLASIWLCLCGNTAKTDLSATFSDPAGRGNLVIELAANGDGRITVDADDYFLIKSGQVYLVSAGPGGPRAMSVEAVAALQQRTVDEGSVAISSESGSRKPLEYVADGPVEVAGYGATAYRVAGAPNVAPVLLSDDPELADLGGAVAQWLDAMDAMTNPALRQQDNLKALRHGKAMIGFAGMRLARIERTPIDPARLVLPGRGHCQMSSGWGRSRPGRPSGNWQVHRFLQPATSRESCLPWKMAER